MADRAPGIAAMVADVDRRGRDVGAALARGLWEGPETGPSITLYESKVDAILALLRTLAVYTATGHREPLAALCDDVRAYLCAELGAASVTQNKQNPAATTTGFRIDPTATDQRTNDMSHSTHPDGSTTS
ncbi:hypothetical protein [Nonomuraea sp. NPDC049758]|uniref:hypothetical protein n=1 Tax=Nonomuraea sp. NPDC049758 TaxID=3154360 RepID=UPI0034152D8F